MVEINSTPKAAIEKMATVMNSNEIAIAEALLEERPYSYLGGKYWYIYDTNEHRYVLKTDDDMLVLFFGAFALQDIVIPKVKQTYLNAARLVGTRFKPKDAKPTWLQLQDTIYDVGTGEVFAASSEYFIVNPIPYKKGTSTKTPAIDMMLIDWVGEKHYLRLKEILAYSLLPNSFMQIWAIFHGEGSNGKSECLKLFEKLVGEHNATSVDFAKFLYDRFEAAKIVKKLVAIVGELPKVTITGGARLKAWISGDKSSFELKGGQPFDARPYALIISACNQLPPTADNSKGYHRRHELFDFPNEFPKGKSPVDNLSTEELENFCAYAVDILPQLLVSQKFTGEKTILEKQKQYEEFAHPLIEFCKNEIDEEFDKHIPKTDFKQKLDKFCKEKKIHTPNDGDIKKYLEANFGAVDVRKKITNYRRSWGNIKWRHDEN